MDNKKRKSLTHWAMDNFALIVAAMVVVGVVLMMLFSAGLDHYITYEGKQMRMSEVEEILGDKLELENPSKDLEVNIFEENDD
jgi:hypothetical protein